MAKLYFEEKHFFFESRADGLDAEAFSVVSFSGDEGISRPYRYVVNLISKDPDIDLEAVLASPATLFLKGDRTLPIHGVLEEFEQLNEIDENYYYRAVLVPTLWHLTQFRVSEVYLSMTVPEIIERVLQDGGLTILDYEMALQNPAAYRRWSYVCQYEETHFDFLSRRMEREGIYYYFEQGDDREKLIITDTDFKHTDLPDESTVHYSPPSGLDSQVQQEVATAFITRRSPMPTKVICQDFNYRKSPPVVSGEAVVSKDGLGEVYLYGGHIKTTAEAEAYAKIRAQEILCRQQVGNGESTAPFLRSGFHFTLDRHYRQDCNRKYLLTAVHHQGSQAALFLSGDGLKRAGEDSHPYYRNTFEAIPAGVQFRPERTTPWPRFSGTINAKVSADGDGQYAEIDEFGRYKVKLPFDRSDRTGQKASRWVRMAQPYQGPDEGMHFPLRKGAEVILTFIDGDPDRPIIAGAVPGAEGQSHVVDANASKNVIHTAGRNRMEMEDQEGNQRILLYSPTVNTWIRMGSPNDPPSTRYVAEGDDISTYRDNTGTWKLYDSGSEVTAKNAAAGDDGSTLLYRLTKQYDVTHTQQTDSSIPPVVTDLYTVGGSTGNAELTRNAAPVVGHKYTFDGFEWTLQTMPTAAVDQTVSATFYREKTVALKIQPEEIYDLGVRYHSEGNIWSEAWDRYIDYVVGYATTDLSWRTSESEPKKLGDLVDTLKGFSPTNLKNYMSGATETFSTGDMSSPGALERAHITATSFDTVNIQEGNIYDFGGFWNYSMGNSYDEKFMAQTGITLNEKQTKDKASAGGPHYGTIEGLSSHGENVWVEKTIGGASYSYTKQSDSLEVKYKCKEIAYSYGGRTEEYKYAGDTDKKILDMWSEAGETVEQKYDRNTGAIMSYHAESSTVGALASFDFSFSAKATAEFTFGFAASFSLSAAAKLAIAVSASAVADISLSTGVSLKVELGASLKAEITGWVGGKYELNTVTGESEAKMLGMKAQQAAALEAKNKALKLEQAFTDIASIKTQLAETITTIYSLKINVNIVSVCVYM